MKNIPRLSSIAFVGAMLSSVSVLAQTAPAGPARPVSEEVIELPSFSVLAEKDDGYIAADTISGSRLSTNLIKTPSDISTLTSEFLSDIGMFDTREALRWLTSSYPTDPVPTDPRDFGGNVTFRGLSAGANTRNFFPYIITVKDYLVDRIEGWRGPNSILYGVGPIGGSVNILTKQPNFANRTMLDFRVDTAGTTRVAVDHNRKISDKVAMRLNAITQDRRTWIEGYVDDLDAVDLAVAVRPWRGATFRVEGEIGRQVNSMSYGAILDRSSSWDGTTVVNGPLTSSPAASTGLVRLTTGYLIASNAWDGALSFLNYARTDGTALSVANAGNFSKFPVLSRKEFWIAPPQARLDNDYHTVQAFYEQQFSSGLVTELAVSTAETVRTGPTYNWQSTYVDVVTTLPNGQPNPNFGEYYSDVQLNNFYRTLNSETTARLAAAYPFKLGGTEQTLSVVAQRDIQHFEPKITMLARDNNPADQNLRSAANAYWYRQYWNQPADLTIPLDSNGYHFSEVATRDTLQSSDMNSLQVNYVGEYLNRNLTIIGGLRYDDYEASVQDIATYDARGYPATYSTQRFGAKVTTGSAGLTYFPIHPVGVYANYSEGFRPLNRNVPALPGEAGANATESNSRTVGLRFRLFDSRIVGSVGYYEAEETGQTQQFSLGTVNQIWVDINQPNKQIQPTAYLDTYDYSAHGFEADITANLTKQWRLKLNVALPKNELSNAYPGSKAYVAANLAAWEAGANDPTNPNRTRIANNIATYLNNTVVAGSNGRTLQGTVDWTVNVFTTYTFNHSFLKGLQVGGGANMYGRRLIGNKLNLPFDYIDAEAYTIASAMIRYDFKIRKLRFEAQINVSNLFDYDNPVFTNVAYYSGQAYRNNYYYIPAREAMFSLKVRF